MFALFVCALLGICAHEFPAKSPQINIHLLLTADRIYNVNIHTYIGYAMFVCPALSVFLFVPQFVRTRLDKYLDDVGNGVSAA